MVEYWSKVCIFAKLELLSLKIVFYEKANF